ncbi:sialin-like [Lytechinus pictus]|uniref:sialin-like n=1 Tax=Lytechinus pictus TaxID=7653 RepID=UPI0030B9DE7F
MISSLDEESPVILQEKNQRNEELGSLLTTVPRPANTICSCRYIVSYMSFFALACAYLNRVNLSVALTAMANSTYSSTYDVGVNSSAEICPARSNESLGEEKEGEFPWDAHTQELILAGFYYGLPLFQIPAGLVADKYPRSTTKILCVAFLISSASNLLIPLAAYNIGASAIIALRVIAGVAESVTYPCLYSLLSRWTPPADRSRQISIAFAGSSAGQIIAQPISGVLCDSDILGGWPSTFYLFGTIGIIWCIPWVLLVYSSPSTHPRISQDEKDYIIAELKYQNTPPKKYPWKNFATSLPLYAVCATDFALLWIYFSLTSNLPIFLKEALRFDITQVGILSSMPHITFVILIMIGGSVADFILNNTPLNLTTVRKIMTTLGLLPAGAFLVLSSYVGCNAGLVITFISLALGMTGFAYSGASLTMMEFATPYAGMCVAIANSVATIPGFVAPLVVAVFTENQADMSGWRSFFWITFGLTVLAWLIFTIFGTSELQPWAQEVKGGNIDSSNGKYGGIHNTCSNGDVFSNGNCNKVGNISNNGNLDHGDNSLHEKEKLMYPNC